MATLSVRQCRLPRVKISYAPSGDSGVTSLMFVGDYETNVGRPWRFGDLPALTSPVMLIGAGIAFYFAYRALRKG
jgi:hypothetical protein